MCNLNCRSIVKALEQARATFQCDCNLCSLSDIQSTYVRTKKLNTFCNSKVVGGEKQEIISRMIRQ